MKTLTIHVTRDDIDHGEIMQCDKCPVARAIKRHIQPDCQVLVNLSNDYGLFVFIDQKPFRLPVPCFWFVDAFDRAAMERAEMQPFEFELTLPEEYFAETAVPA